MKMKIKFLCSILIMILAFCISLPITAKASYTYKIKMIIGGTGDENAAFVNDLSSGLTVISDTATVALSNDKSSIEISDLQYGDDIVFDPKSSVEISAVETSKYYVKGIRRSGADSVSTKSAFTVDRDETYVIAYGVGEVVPYQVSYLDEAGVSLASTATFYGALGEEIYIPYRYIEGYVPNTLNIHCISLKESQKFEFIYRKGSATADAQTASSGNGRTEYSSIAGEPEYIYQSVSRPGDATGTVNNRSGLNVAAGNNDDDNNGEANVGEATIQEDETPLGIEDVMEISDEEVARIGEKDDILTIYKRYAILVTVFGLMSIITTMIVSAKKKEK